MAVNYIDQIAAANEYNNQFNYQMMQETNAFNALEAAKQRKWQEKMSNTAFQRQVKDLQEAGLNPILGYMNGTQATTPTGGQASGVSAKADTSLANGLISMMNSMIQAQSAQAVANIYAEASRYSADKQLSGTVYNANETTRRETYKHDNLSADEREYIRSMVEVANQSNSTTQVGQIMTLIGVMFGTAGTVFARKLGKGSTFNIINKMPK